MLLKYEKKWTLPPEGMHNAVCVDITPPRVVDTQYGPKEKLRIVWELGAKMTEKDTESDKLVGKPFLASKSYTLSLGEKSNLRKDLKSWRGKDFSVEELSGFETESILGANCQLLVQHEALPDGELYAKITVLKAGAVRITPCGSYVRVKDREDKHGPSQIGRPAQSPPPTTRTSPRASQVARQAIPEARRINEELDLAAEGTETDDCPF